VMRVDQKKTGSYFFVAVKFFERRVKKAAKSYHPSSENSNKKKIPTQISRLSKKTIH